MSDEMMWGEKGEALRFTSRASDRGRPNPLKVEGCGQGRVNAYLSQLEEMAI